MNKTFSLLIAFVCIVALGVTGVGLSGCQTPGGTYTVDFDQLTRALVFLDTALEIAENRGLINQEDPVEDRISIKDRILEIILTKLEEGVQDIDLEDIDLEDIVNQVKVEKSASAEGG